MTVIKNVNDLDVNVTYTATVHNHSEYGAATLKYDGHFWIAKMRSGECMASSHHWVIN